ncbi:CDP-diacylglycerol pyrophosphatase [Advenella kashmirensis WT001]|uniref:CDP-diacylglycerol pyrophosphatase n=1 Tax=Advenella kashmirensis (strain DSM 17095 / LMG 22695 / WT001) TaxID=1036672 RepID=I3UBF8_ADVKW|nr:CDP-diacylglycerol diphosphatase [Advenella kashmirensis]AFK62346.1 CDP-diacylglycerol pyrophosphatase [Advenella kashmirensis WT001]
MSVRSRCGLAAMLMAVSLLTACNTSAVPEPKAAVPTKQVARGDILWHFVHDQCIPNQLAGKNPPLPCIKVDMDKGYVIFKDKNGPLQYLHMPTRHVTGLEDPTLLSASRTPYFAQAWHARHYMDRLLGRAIPVQDYSFTINSKSGRSQNHLHTHISCIRPALRERLLAMQSQFNSQWQPVPGGINGHAYQARTLSLGELEQRGAIALTITTLAHARQDMANVSLALYPLSERQFLLFATHRPGASSEGDFQDHRCPQLLASR